MGVIYILRGPNRNYIGQHKTNVPETRMKSHVAGFRSYERALKELKALQEIGETDEDLVRKTTKGCICLYRAFTKYGVEAFEYEVLHTNILLEKLNELEDQCIIEYNSLAPNGYNLRLNNANGEHKTLSEESRKRFSKAAVLKNEKYRDKYLKYPDEMKDIPRYVTYYQDKDGYRGYKVWKHPQCRSKSFTSKTIPLNILKIRCINFLKELGDKNHIKSKRKLPIGIFKPSNRKGYMAYFKVNSKRTNAYFSSSTDEENLQSAIDWLKTNRPKRN